MHSPQYKNSSNLRPAQLNSLAKQGSIDRIQGKIQELIGKIFPGFKKSSRDTDFIDSSIDSQQFLSYLKEKDKRMHIANTAKNSHFGGMAAGDIEYSNFIPLLSGGPSTAREKTLNPQSGFRIISIGKNRNNPEALSMPQFLSIHEYRMFATPSGLDKQGRIQYKKDNFGEIIFKTEMSEAGNWEAVGYQLSGKSGVRIYLQRCSTMNSKVVKTMELSIDKNEGMNGAYGLFNGENLQGMTQGDDRKIKSVRLQLGGFSHSLKTISPYRGQSLAMQWILNKKSNLLQKPITVSSGGVIAKVTNRFGSIIE